MCLIVQLVTTDTPLSARSVLRYHRSQKPCDLSWLFSMRGFCEIFDFFCLVLLLDIYSDPA
jgi:hypothetical protein